MNLNQKPAVAGNNNVGLAIMKECAKTGRAIIKPPKRSSQPQKPAIKTEVAKLRLEKFTLKLEGFFTKFLVATDIAGKVQINTPSGGNMGSKKPAVPATARYEMATVDLASLMARVSVDSISINVSRQDDSEFHTIFINCTVGNGPGSGFNKWGESDGGVYEKLIRRICEDRIWGVATLREVTKGDKTFLNLSKGKTTLTAKSIIRFAIDQGGK